MRYILVDHNGKVYVVDFREYCIALMIPNSDSFIMYYYDRDVAVVHIDGIAVYVTGDALNDLLDQLESLIRRCKYIEA